MLRLSDFSLHIRLLNRDLALFLLIYLQEDHGISVHVRNPSAVSDKQRLSPSFQLPVVGPFRLWPMLSRNLYSSGKWLASRLKFLNDSTLRGSKSKGWFYELGVLFSKEKRAERAKALQEEVNRGRFYELNELKATGGKIFESSDMLSPVAESKLFPGIMGVPLSEGGSASALQLRGKVTLVTICLRYQIEYYILIPTENSFHCYFQEISLGPW